MGFNAAVRSCFRQFATFTGRARRAEFWMFYLFLMLVQLLGGLVVVIVALVAIALPVIRGGAPSIAGVAIFSVIGVLWWGAVTALLIPFYAVSARRLHDMGQSGHWLWLNLAGLGMVPLIMAFLDSQYGPNQWGPDPKASERIGYVHAPGYAYAPPPDAPQ